MWTAQSRYIATTFKIYNITHYSQSLCLLITFAAIPERVRVELCESCGAFVYWSPLNESTQSESSLNNNTTALLVTRAKVRLKRAQKYPKTLNHLVQSERKKLSTTQQQPQRIYIRNFLVIRANSDWFRRFWTITIIFLDFRK